MTSQKRAPQSALRRLQRDYLEWREDAKHFKNVGACPLEEDMMNWHFNIVIGDVALHGEIKFPETYPFHPPRVSFFGDVPHQQVDFKRTHGRGYLCLNMLQHQSDGYYRGWSSAYSVVSVIAQMETLLHRLGKNQLPHSWQTFSCDVCGHDGRHREEFYPKPAPKPVRAIEKSGESLTCVTTNECFWTLLHRDVAGVIFGFLSQTDLGCLMFANVHLQQALYHSQVYHNRMVTCFHSHANFGEFSDVHRSLKRRETEFVRGHLFGIGFSSKYWENENSRNGAVTRVLKDLNIVPDVLSFGAFREGVRFSVWREERFDEFLPLYLNNQHGKIGLDMAEKVIKKVYGDEQRSASAMFEPLMALRFLSKVMNTTVVRLMQEVEENGATSVPLFTSIKALQSYMYCYHLLIGFAKRYPLILKHAQEKVNEFVFAPHLRDKKHFPDAGELLIYLTIVPMSWSVFGPVMIEEVLCRNAKWILQECPWLIQTDKNNEVSCVRMRQSFEKTIVSKRLQMFQFYFLQNVCGVGKSRVLFNLNGKLKEMNGCLGQVRESVAVGLQKRCRRIFQVDDWFQYFELIELPCPSARRLSHELREAMLESDRKGYQRFVETKIDLKDEAHTAHEDPDLCLCSGKIFSLSSREEEMKDREGNDDEVSVAGSGRRRRALDVAFCVDCTGSMSSYLASVKVHIAEIARELNREENVDVRFAMVGYRDHDGEAGDWAPNVTKVAQFGELNRFATELEDFRVGGGGGVEAVADGWNDILGLKWRRMSVKAVIQVADIGCHGLSSAHDACPCGYDPIVLAREMLKRDITLYNVGCTMRGQPSEEFFRGTAHMTGGLYLTLANATKLPQVILESTKEGLSLTKIIPQVFELMTACRKQNPLATRDQLGYLVWRELVTRKVKTSKVSCVAVNGSKVTDCVTEISEASTLEEVRQVLAKYPQRRPYAYAYAYGYGGYASSYGAAPARKESTKKKKRVRRKKGVDGRLITLEQTMRCMNRAGQMGNRMQWIKHGCMYRKKKYCDAEAEKRCVEYGVDCRSTIRRIKRHKFPVRTAVEFTDYKTKRVFFGTVVEVNERKFEMSIRLEGLRNPKRIPLTSRSVNKCGTVLKKIVVKIEGSNPVGINAWQRNGKTLAAKMRGVSSSVDDGQKTVSEEMNESVEAMQIEQEERKEPAVMSVPRVGVSPSFEACQLNGKEMVVRSMLSIVPPQSLWGAIDSVRRVHDQAYCRWMPNIALLFPFVDRDLFECHGRDLQAVFELCGLRRFGLEVFGFDFVDRVSTVRDSNPVVSVHLKARVVSDGHRNDWEKLLDCVCKMYPNVADRVRNLKPHLVVARVARRDAKRLVCDLEREWKQKRLLPMQFEVDSVRFLSRRENGLSARFVVDNVAPFAQ